MVIRRPSSPVRRIEPEPPPVVHVSAEDPTRTPYIDEGLPIPLDYDIDIIRALLQDPFRIFVYWSVRESSLASLTRYFSPEDAGTFKVVLKLAELTAGHDAFFEVGWQGRYWMTVFPDRRYEFEIGARSDLHGYIPLVRSNVITTPRGTISPDPSPDDEYRIAPGEFMGVVEASGFGPEQALDISISTLPGRIANPDLLRSFLLKLPAPIRSALLVAAAGGALTDEMIFELPDPLRNELLALLRRSGGIIAALGLMHYLPELLREVLADERELVGDHIHPLHFAPRFFAGGTENLSWPGSEIRLPALPRRPSSPGPSGAGVTEI